MASRRAQHEDPPVPGGYGMTDAEIKAIAAKVWPAQGDDEADPLTRTRIVE